MRPALALKIDVDTERGTRLGVPALTRLLRERGVPATFLFSLGPDNTGKAIRRIFRRGFFAKVSRTSVLEIYGLRTLLNGTLCPAPHIGRRHANLLREVRDAGFEVGIHCHDHFRWQDYVTSLPREAVQREFSLARAEFVRIFGREARTAGAPGWQTGPHGRLAYDEAGLRYSSDTRGETPFYPRIGATTYRTLEIPTTLPTLDELMGRPEYPDHRLIDHYRTLLRPDRLNVLTLHAEIEGLGRATLFRHMLAMLEAEVEFVRLDAVADRLLGLSRRPPVHALIMAPIDGRSGLVATQGPAGA